MDAVVTHAPSEWKLGGRMLLSATIGLAFATFPLTLIGLLVRPLSEAFGWSRASVSAGFFITACGTLLLAPIVGPLVDRVGPRRVALCGLIAVACGSVAIGLAGPSIFSWYLSWSLFGAAQAFANGVVWSNAIVSRFDKHRGAALGLFLSGLAAATGLGPVLGVVIMNQLGWRSIFFLGAAAILLVAWPISWRLFYGLKDLPLTDRPALEGITGRAGRHSTFHSLRTREFWQIAVAFSVAAASIGALVVHLQPILTDTGVSPQTAALVAFAIGPAAIAGRLICGVLLDRFPPNIVASVTLLLPGIAYTILMLDGVSIVGAYACAVLIGLSAGAETDMLAYLVSRYFPPYLYSSTYAILLGLFGVGYGLAPVIAGGVFDATHSYRPIFIFLMVAAVTGATLVATLGRPSARRNGDNWPDDIRLKSRPVGSRAET